MGLVPDCDLWQLEPLDPSQFHFSTPGVARVELSVSNLFYLLPEGQGSTVLTYSTQAGVEYTLEVVVAMPEASYEFVLADSTAPSGYRLWQSSQGIVGDQSEREVFFAQVTVTSDGVVRSANLLAFPQDLQVQAPDSAVFDLVRKGDTWHIRTAPVEPGEYTLAITATPPGAAFPQTWEKRLYASVAIVVTENTVAAINEAIQGAEIQSGYETVILLPPGYVPMDYYTPVILDRPVTLRGQGTILSSDVAAICQTPGAKLENVTIRFAPGSYWDRSSRVSPMNNADLPSVKYNEYGISAAICGDGIITLEDCELDGGAGRWQAHKGISMVGDRVTFQGANTIRNFFLAGWCVESAPGLRRTFQGLTFQANYVAVRVIQTGSTDPYFIRLTESNFIGNSINVYAPFSVNFAHNYFSGGDDGEHIMKSPQYTEPLDLGDGNPMAELPLLRIEADRLDFTDLLNFEGRSPISTENFPATGEPVLIRVKELGDTEVREADGSNLVLQWTFHPTQTGGSPLFRPDAYIDEKLELPLGSGVERYQGVSFAHHGPLPMEGAEISVLKKTLFEEETLHLYRLANGVLTHLGEIENTSGEFYTFHLDSCSDYIITNVEVESAGGGGGGGSEGGGNGNSGNQGGSNGSGNGSGSGGSGEGNSGGGDTSEGSIPGDGGDADGNNNGKSNDSGIPSADKTDADGGTAPFTDSIQGTAVVANQSPLAPFLEERQYHTTGNGDGVSEFVEFLVDERASGNAGLAAFTDLPAPPGGLAAPQTISANRYVDDTAIRTAFDNPCDGQVVIDVSVRTAVSPLAFQLLAETPELILVLKGDGYEWRFTGGDVRDAAIQNTFDTSVNWNAAQEEGYARLSFGQQGELPGSCVLILETANHPHGWAAYNPFQYHYMPCTLNVRQQGLRMQMNLDKLGEYVALL